MELEPMFQVTEWGDPAEVINTTKHGKICYNHWCQLECERWGQKWRTAWVVEHPGNDALKIKPGSVAMFSFRRYMAAVTPLEGEE